MKSIFLLLISILVFCCSWSFAEDKAITEAGDHIQIVLPLLALGSTYDYGAREWRKDQVKAFWKSFGYGLLTTYAGKGLLGKLRPNQTNRKSFPSGHTYSAFSGASFLNSKFGWKVGVPAFAAASFVGYSRIQGEHHFMNDVLGGASIALLFNWHFTETLNKNNASLAMIPNKDGGMALQISAPTDVKLSKLKKKSMQYHFYFGHKKLISRGLRDGNNQTLSLKDLALRDDPLVVAKMKIRFLTKGKQIFDFEFAPTDFRDNGTLSSSMSHDGDTIGSGSSVETELKNYHLEFSYLRPLYSKGSIRVLGGIGIGPHYRRIVFTSGSTKLSDERTMLFIRPHLLVQWLVCNRSSFDFRFRGLGFTDDLESGYQYEQIAVDYGYQLDERYKVVLSTEYKDQEDKLLSLSGKVVSQLYQIGIIRSF